ncbi:MAG: hypothetical protein U0T75_12710 [Chitinophagales bacterium]
MLDLRSALLNISRRWNYKMDELSPEVWRLDVAIPIQDGKFRYQFVYVWIAKGRWFNQKDCIFINSRCGTYTQALNHYNLLKEAGFGFYTSVTVANDKDAEGRPCETVAVQAAPLLEFTTTELLNEIIYEVAYHADLIEERFFGGDKN